MKILLLSTRFYPSVGGVENVVKNLATEFSREGHEVAVLSSLQAGLFKIEEDIEEYENYKIKRIWMVLPRSILGFLIFPIRFCLACVKLVSYVKNFKPDIVNFHFMDDASVYVWLLSLVYKCPIVVNIHGNDIQVFAHKPFYKFFIKKILNSSNAIIVNSEYMRNVVLAYSDSYKEKIRIISNGLDVQLVKSIHPQKYISEPYIFYVGRLVHKKGVDVLIEAFYKANIPNLKLVIEGSGEESDSLKKLINRFELKDKIIMTEGKNSYEQMLSYMKGAVFGVVPSRIEPFGIVALEFLASGTPLIASKTGGLVNILSEGQTCLFFENENIADLADKIKLLYTNTGLRMRLSVNGSERVKDYMWNKIAQKYLIVFNENKK